VTGQGRRFGRLVVVSAWRALFGFLSLGLLSPGRASAAGLYFSDRGVRPLGRGGAFVAGADDLGAIWYNPAGLADAGSSFLLDASWLHFTSDYTRQTQVSGAGPGGAPTGGPLYTYTFAQTHGTSPVLPIPTIAGSFAFGKKKEWTVALGAFAPYTAIASYPQNAPSRYSLVSLDGSALVETGAWLAYKPADWIRLGAGFQLLVGKFTSSVVMNANPKDRVLAAPEDPAYDGLSQISVGPIIAPSGNLGVTLVPESHVRVGISGQAPTHISSPATLAVALPNAPVFDSAQQVGNQANVTFNLPPVFRAGIEVRPVDRLRVELAYVREFWSVHQSIVIQPTHVSIDNITGFPSPYNVATITIPRNFQDSNSVRLGGEFGMPIAQYVVDLRMGVQYETSAIPTAYLSPLTVDMNKFVFSFGGSLHIATHWRFDIVYAHVFAFTTTVTPAEAAIPQINPVRGNPTNTETVNGGTYAARADVLGVGLNYTF
jgi:long-chain fatty acid transport protein